VQYFADFTMPRILAGVDQAVYGITPDQAGEVREILRELHREEFAARSLRGANPSRLSPC
jgi:hypothetical protein